MPTNLASKAIAPRMRSARARRVPSASGSVSGSAKGFPLRRIVEPRLQDELGGDFVPHGFAIARAHACGGERALGLLCGIALVHARHLDAEAAFQLPREPLG